MKAEAKLNYLERFAHCQVFHGRREPLRFNADRTAKNIVITHIRNARGVRGNR